MIGSNRTAKLQIIAGVVLLLLAALLLLLGSIFWYLAFVAGGPLLLSRLNQETWQMSLPGYLHHRRRAILPVYAVFAGTGSAVELVRVLPDLWEYADPLNGVLASTIWIGAIYPLFFWLIFESFVLFKGITGKSSLGALLALAFLILWNDVPNLFLPLWTVNKPEPIFMRVLFATGYILEALIAVLVYEFLVVDSGQRTPQDGGLLP